MATSRTNLTFLDRFSKVASVSVHSVLLTAGNFAAQATARASYVTATEDLTLCLLQKETVLAFEIKNSIAAPTDDGAVKGVRWLVRATDVNGNAVTWQIPGANLSLTMSGNNLDLASTEGAAFVTAAEAFVLSNDGEAITIAEVIYLDQ